MPKLKAIQSPELHIGIFMVPAGKLKVQIHHVKIVAGPFYFILNGLSKVCRTVDKSNEKLDIL